MCDTYTPACNCFRNEQEHAEETARIAATSALERQVLDLLTDARADADADAPLASPLAIGLAEVIRRAATGQVIDVLVTDAGNATGALFWIDGGAQHYAPLDQAAIRLAA